MAYFFVQCSRWERVTGSGDERPSQTRPDHRRRYVYIATTAILSTRETDFCFDALVLGSVLILASGHISSCKPCWIVTSFLLLRAQTSRPHALYITVLSYHSGEHGKTMIFMMNRKKSSWSIVWRGDNTQRPLPQDANR
ncbi:hypothetical protein E2C01_030754 [Portunus trituberculatus]|uniref:Uncharacterized protein n=1 Tax=Portunus trituberculatus TaxID=210409 RepID=A0A5B7ER96_PORTR|nr:hypothetical protein [Portunus trituberculatus]